MSRRSALDRPVRRALRYSLADAVASSVMVGAGESYLPAFAVFLHASAQQMAWLAAFPPLIGSWMQLVSAWVGRGQGRRKRVIVGGALGQALSWVPMMLAPLLLPAHAATAFIAFVIGYHACNHLVQPQWGSLMRDLVPERRRGRFFARRNRRVSVVTFAGLIAAGSVLHVFDAYGVTYTGFAAVFSCAALARIASATLLARMHDPGEAPPEAGYATVAGMRERLRALRGSPFLRFALTLAVMQGAVALSSPFWSLYILRELHFSYLEFMAAASVSVLMQFATLHAWGSISDRFGNRVVMVTTAYLIPLIPALWLISDSFWFLIGVQMLSGLAWGGFNLSTANYLYDLRPGTPLARYMAVSAVLTSALVFVGAMSGGWLAGVLPHELSVHGLHFTWPHALYPVFAVGALARGLVALLLMRRLREVREVGRITMRELVVRMARLNAVSGMVVDVVAAVRRPR